jgi:hypothetical protein
VADEIAITKVQEETNFDANGQPKAQVRVSFRIGTDGPFSKVYDRATFNASTARREIDDFARELRTLRGN